jgi:nitrate ABC transporter ATP-binding subunit
MSQYLELSQIGKSYPSKDGRAVIVQNFNLKVAQGEFISIIGHSGCGKSTVLSMLAGLNEPTEGVMVLAGKEVTGPGPDRGIVFQSPCLLPWLTAFENVLLGVDQVFPNAARSERHQVVEYYLSIVGLADSMHRRPSEISAGMRQRVGIARAFALAPKMLLLDEPFGMLDSLTRMELQEVLVNLWRRDQKTAVMVTHDVDEALFLSDRVVMMTDGPAAEVGDILTVPFPHPRKRQDILGHPDYGRLRDHLIEFLEIHAHRKMVHPNLAAPVSATAQSPDPSSAPEPRTAPATL